MKLVDFLKKSLKRDNWGSCEKFDIFESAFLNILNLKQFNHVLVWVKLWKKSLQGEYIIVL